MSIVFQEWIDYLFEKLVFQYIDVWTGGIIQWDMQLVYSGFFV